MIYVIFRFAYILAGTMLACLGACVWTLMIGHLFRVRIGLLTANLATIIFVLTLSHIIFLTFR